MVSTIDARNVAPGDLVIAANVRSDTKVDKTFVSNIKQHGVVVPILVEQGPDDTLLVVDGQRRAIAAVEAGLAEVPVIVRPAIAADSDRIVQQLIVNDQRTSLSDVEHAAAYQQLSLFGVSADQIARRTNSPRKKVDVALAVAASPFATELATSKAVTLEHAAAIVEFEDQPDLAERLAQIAVEYPNRFEHELLETRTRREQRRAKETLTAELMEAGIALLAERPQHKDRGVIMRVDELYTDDAHEHPLAEVSTDRPQGDIPGLSAYVYLDWANPDPEPDLDGMSEEEANDAAEAYDDGYRYVPTADYYVMDWQQAGYQTFTPLPSGTSPTPAQGDAEADAQAEADKAARRRVIANNKAWPIATGVRRTWIQETLLAKIPDDAAYLIAMWLGSALPRESYNVDLHQAITWLDIDSDTEHWQPKIVGNHLDAHRGDSLRTALAIVVSAIESQLSPKDAWRDGYGRQISQIAAYLVQLTAWGYGLSAVEQEIVDEAA